ncbi:DUF6538 domain-containing protein [Georhizobium profundi]|uniref:DUF6538 domain-containing protein n=1 Tax=Georhizobium profundi TaxID=2341112 RepID=UPI00315CFE50
MRHSQKVDPDRFLVQQSGIYYYWRRVPARFLPLDGRTASGLIRASLKTDDLAEARAKRDALEAADQDYWVATPLRCTWPMSASRSTWRGRPRLASFSETTWTCW